MAERPSSGNISTKLERIAKLAKQMPGVALTTLAHHIDLEWLNEAYRRTRKDGAVGVDGQTAAEYAVNLQDNLKSLLDRAKSGDHYRAPPVRRVHIPKGDGHTTRPIGIPAFEDKVLQRAVAMVLEAIYEQDFLDCSYGFRPKRSAHQALRAVWKQAMDLGGCWVLEADIEDFFDNLDHALVMRAVRKYTQCQWVLLYVQRWLQAPLQMPDGTLVPRTKGTPQGGVVSPPLANIFLHLAFDDWMRQTHPDVPFERYADDVVAHCRTEEEAQAIRRSIEKRLGQCKLQLHPQKTKIVYCKDDDRRGRYEHEKFDFLGYTFRPRRSKNRWGKHFISFTPAVSNDAATKMRRTMRSWRLHLRSDKAIDDLARMWNPVLRGWIQYYGRFYKSALYSVFRHLNRTLARWANRKFKRLRRHRRRAEHWLGGVARREPQLFAHWQMLGLRPMAG